MSADSPAGIHTETTTGAGGPGIPPLAPEFAGEALEAIAGPTGDGQVQLAYCHEHEVSHSWHMSMMQMLAYDKSVGMNLIGSAPFMVSCSGPHGLVEGRNLAVKHFLDETTHEWLFWVDTDMGFQSDSLDRLMVAADSAERPVVAGLCFAFKQMQPDGYGGFRMAPLPTLFSLARDKAGVIGFVNRTVYPENSLVQVAGTGSAFILIHRSVLEDVRAKHGDEWYSLISYEDGRSMSEDLSFCWRVGDVARPVLVHTGVKTTHHKMLWVSDLDYQQPEVDPVFQTKRMDASEHANQCPECGSYRIDGQPPILHRDDCSHKARYGGNL